jgi:hypothetical protein
MKMPKVLVACPTNRCKDYILERYIDRIKNLDYPNYDILLVDNSKGNSYFNKIKKLGVRVIKSKYYKDSRRRVVESRNMIRDEVLKNGYEYYFSLEQDVIPRPDILKILVSHKKNVVAGWYFINNPIKGMPYDTSRPCCSRGWTMYKMKFTYIMPTGELMAKQRLMKSALLSLGVCLIHRKVLEQIKFKYYHHYPNHHDDTWFFFDCEKKKIDLWTDSVTKDTPILIRRFRKFIDFIPICELYPKYSYINSKNRKFLKYANRYYGIPKDIEVLTKEGKWSKIKYIYGHRIKKPIYKIIAGKCMTKVTGDHSVFSEGNLIEVKYIKINDFIDSASIPYNEFACLNKDIAWFFGFFAAEGYCCLGKNNNFEMSNKSIDLLEKAEEIINNNYNYSCHYFKDNGGVYKLQLRGLKKDFIILMRKKFYNCLNEKRIPIEILNASKAIKMSFLEGLWAGDGKGNLNSKKASICTKSMTLASGICYLLDNLGIDYTIVNGRSDKPNIIEINLVRKFRRTEENRIKFKKKMNSEDELVFDIETEDESHSFVAGIGGISHHNTELLVPHFQSSWKEHLEKNAEVEKNRIK